MTTTFVYEASFVADAQNEPYDFRNMFLLLSKHFELDKDFTFTRKPTVDYFSAVGASNAERFLSGKDKKGGLLVTPGFKIGKITLKRVSDKSFEVLTSELTTLKTRQKVELGERVAIVGTRTGEFYYVATINATSGNLEETIQTRNNIAIRVRELLIAQTSPELIFDGLLSEVLSIPNENPSNTTRFDFLKDRNVRKDPKTETVRMAQLLARKLYNYWIDENKDVLQDVILKTTEIFAQMQRDEFDRRLGLQAELPLTEKHDTAGEPGELGEPGEPASESEDNPF